MRLAVRYAKKINAVRKFRQTRKERRSVQILYLWFPQIQYEIPRKRNPLLTCPRRRQHLQGFFFISRFPFSFYYYHPRYFWSMRHIIADWGSRSGRSRSVCHGFYTLANLSFTNLQLHVFINPAASRTHHPEVTSGHFAIAATRSSHNSKKLRILSLDLTLTIHNKQTLGRSRITQGYNFTYHLNIDGPPITEHTLTLHTLKPLVF